MQVLLLILSLYTACFAFSSEYKFEISHTSQKKIYELITTIADTPAPLLICNLSRINQLKNDLQQLEPLQFLAYIFNSPYLTYEMEKIKGCSSKYAPQKQVFASFCFKRILKKRFQLLLHLLGLI
ncbi:MAG: hypothetical protein FJZ56_03635 [Chlamydiae bacterium]|nr:hypothetical protein [Chlamydiota bacterium]